MQPHINSLKLLVESDGSMQREIGLDLRGKFVFSTSKLYLKLQSVMMKKIIPASYCINHFDKLVNQGNVKKSFPTLIFMYLLKNRLFIFWLQIAALKNKT